ncbi:DUF3102 domain-containing protein [Virgibacillus oceani]
MNEVVKLSNDLNVITAEINSYKQVAGQAIFEIGKRLKHVKENDLAYGQWSTWLESIGMNRSTAHRFVKTYEELPSDVDTWQQLSSRALYEIATLPQEEREKGHALSSGETKTVDEMTVRELKEVKKQLKQAEEANEKLGELLTEERNKEPEQVEVPPVDYHEIKGNFEAAQRLRDRYKSENEQLRKELDNLSNSIKSKDGDESELKEMKEKEFKLKRKIDEYDKLYDIQTNLEHIISVIAPKIHAVKKENVTNEFGIIDDFESTLDEVIRICDEAKGKLPDKNIIEGEIVNDEYSRTSF